jgi:FG-GAP-like repeat
MKILVWRWLDPAAPKGLRRALDVVRPIAVVALTLVLASCGGDDHCRNCGPSFPSTEVSYGLVAADFTGNGSTSIIQTSLVTNGPQSGPGNLKAYLSTGPGAFAVPVLTNDGDNPLFLATADLNGDHLPDVVSASFDDGTLSVFFNNAQTPGSLNTPLVLSSPGASQVAIADMNGDGLPDLISADYGVSLFLQSSPGTFANPISLYPGGANWVAVGDLNGDGIPDVVVTDNVGVKLLLHTGAATATTFAAPISVYTEAANAAFLGANLVAIADVNGDGLNDLIVTDPGPAGGGSPMVFVLLQNAAAPGTFLPAVGYATLAGSLAQSISVIDVNADTHPDIVIGGTSAVTVLLQDGANPGTFLAATNYPAVNANQIAVADINGDGLLDIVVATGATQPVENGVITNEPGVLLQSASAPGSFTALQNLP